MKLSINKNISLKNKRIKPISTIVKLTFGAVLFTGSLFSHAETASINNTETMKAEVVSNQLNIHTDWQALLSQYINVIDNGHSTAVDYTGIQQNQSLLQGYLNQLSQISQSEFDNWSKDKQLAFLINAYNAWTIEFVLTKYPELESIKDLGNFLNSPWDKEFIPLFGESVSLNHIEHELIRGSGRYNDPRIHFAVNCASIGCPALREEAYTADKLEQQLTEQTERFLTDQNRNYFKDGNLYLSSIFKWYGDDFEAGFRNTETIEDFVLLYADALKLTDNHQSDLAEKKLDIKFLTYNWELNKSK